MFSLSAFAHQRVEPCQFPRIILFIHYSNQSHCCYYLVMIICMCCVVKVAKIPWERFSVEPCQEAVETKGLSHNLCLVSLCVHANQSLLTVVSC